jgi:molybdopterin/thiamine biosynthesis adenylyltransferase
VSRSIVVVGVGNIGSHLVPHLGRMGDVGRVTLIDRDAYEAANLASQDITRRDVGQPKAVVQAGRLCRVAPGLRVIAIAEAVEHVPLGLLRADVLIACLDSRGARRAVAEHAWRLGMPLIDAGVRGYDLLARVNVYLPDDDQPCYACTLGDEPDAGPHPCDGADEPAATAAPSALGALAAALEALECQKLLGGDEHVAVGRQVTICARTHRHFVTVFARDPACPFDHATWTIESSARGPEAMALADVLALGGGTHLRVADQPFVTGLVCAACGHVARVAPTVRGRLTQAAAVCEACGGAARPAAGDLLEWIGPDDLPAGAGAPLAALGLRAGDVVSVTGGARTVHVQLGGVP